jgi:hypothetical protein
MPQAQEKQVESKKDIKIIIPDIHGCFNPLLEVLETAKALYPEHKRIYLGDYVSRGPDSIPVLEFVKKEVSCGHIALIGNHEVVFLEYLLGGGDYYLADAFSGKATIQSARRTSHYSISSSHKDILRFMDRTGLARFMVELPHFYIDNNWIFTHAAAGRDTYEGLVPNRKAALWTSINKGNWKTQMNPPEGYFLACGHSMIPKNKYGQRLPLIFPGKGVYLDCGMGKESCAQFCLGVIENNIFIGYITEVGFTPTERVP